LKILKKNVQIVKRAKQLSQCAFFPNIIGFASYSYKNGPMPTGDTLNLFNDTLYMSDNFVWGLSFQLDLFKGGKRVLNVLKTSKQYKQINLLYANKINQAKNEIENFKNKYNVAKMNIEMYETALNTAQEAYTMAKKQYDLGIIDNNRFLDAQNNYIRAQVNYSKGLYEKAVNYYTLLNATNNMENIQEVK